MTTIEEFDKWIIPHLDKHPLALIDKSIKQLCCLFTDHVLENTDVTDEKLAKLQREYSELDEKFDDYKGQVDSAKESIEDYLSRAESACDELEI